MNERERAPSLFRSHDPYGFADRKEAVLTAAVSLFQERGYDRTSIQDVADQLGISKAAVYYYFKTKESILCAIYERALDEALEILAHLTATISEPQERMSAVIRALVRLVVQDQSLMKVFFREFEALSPPIRAEMRAKSRRYDERVREALVDGIESGAFRDDIDPAIAARAVVGMINWMHRWYHPDGPASPEDVAETMLALLERGYLAEQPAPSPA